MNNQQRPSSRLPLLLILLLVPLMLAARWFAVDEFDYAVIPIACRDGIKYGLATTTSETTREIEIFTYDDFDEIVHFHGVVAFEDPAAFAGETLPDAPISGVLYDTVLFTTPVTPGTRVVLYAYGGGRHSNYVEDCTLAERLKSDVPSDFYDSHQEMILPRLHVAYIYNDNLSLRDYFIEFLEADAYADSLDAVGMVVHPVQLSEVADFDFSNMWAILIGADTGELNTPWLGSQAAIDHIEDSKKKVIALGIGGSTFLNDSYFLLPHRNMQTRGSGTDPVDKRESLNDIWSARYTIYGSQQTYYEAGRAVFSPEYDAYATYYDNQLVDVLAEHALVDRPALMTNYNYPAHCYLFWSFNRGPNVMTPDGKKILVNAIQGNPCRYLNVSIPDHSSRSAIQVPDSKIVNDVNLGISLDVDQVADLRIYLISPQGTRKLLLDNVGQNSSELGQFRACDLQDPRVLDGGRLGAEFALTLDDDSAFALSDGSGDFVDYAYHSRGYVLGDFNGENSHGTWQLEIVNENASRTDGVLRCWFLEIEPRMFKTSLPLMTRE